MKASVNHENLIDKALLCIFAPIFFIMFAATVAVAILAYFLMLMAAITFKLYAVRGGGTPKILNKAIDKIAGMPER